MYCSLCGNLGAGLGCKLKDCRKTYHYKCLLSDEVDCRFNFSEFTIYCPDHVEEYDKMLEYDNIYCKKC